MARPRSRAFYAKQDADRKKAEEMNAAGAKEYSFFWLKANQAAVRILHDLGLPSQDNKLLGVTIATEIARYYRLGQQHAPRVGDTK